MFINSSLKAVLLCLVVVIIAACGESPEKDQVYEFASATSKDDVFWQDCAWLTSDELAEADRLQRKIAQASTASKDDFDRYVKILNLDAKSDADLVKCVKATPKERQKLMEHFVFLGLSYGQGEFSFVDKPRLASIFEMDYFYLDQKRNFGGNSLVRGDYFSEANRRLAQYRLGSVIAMHAAVLSKKHVELGDAAENIAQSFAIIKYGRTSIFNKILFDLRENLVEKVGTFLFADRAFSRAHDTLQSETTTKVYPAFLKQDHPHWPIDYSEVFAERFFENKLPATVFGVGSSTGGTPLGTGFLAKRNNHVLFMTSGHWAWNRRIYIMEQKNSDPFGREKSELIWLNEQLDLFNFSEQLLEPTLKAIGFSGAQLGSLKNKIGNNPFGSAFGELRSFLPWIDMALALPSNSLFSRTGLTKGQLAELYAMPEDTSSTTVVMGFGITEDLIKGDLVTTKSPGFRRMHHGNLFFFEIGDEVIRQTGKRQVTYAPTRLEEMPLTATNPTFSMRMGPRCSGSPFFIDYVKTQPRVVGLLQGPVNIGDKQMGVVNVHFTENSLKLIDALITGPQKLHDIPENQLIDLVRTHMLSDGQHRTKLKNALIAAYGI
ncbi:MAG TPA: hypothetical protein VEL47_06755 [Myxococcota bacterium]|nr:hypothetical protein [Myxococcota bacterium]